MKKIFYTIAVAFVCAGFCSVKTEAEEMVKIEIPASSLEKIDVKYEKESPSVTDKAVKATKDATNKTVEATKKATDRTVKATKKATDKTVKATKKATDKTVKATKKATDKTFEATKKATKKTVDATKDFTEKTIENTKNFFEDVNPNKPVTIEGLKSEATLKTLKNERKELKSAYNSRIKDINAKIRATQKSTLISDVQKRDRIYALNKQKDELIKQRDNTIKNYDERIKKHKENARKEL